MIGRICHFYHGYTHEICLKMTLSQIQGMYWESYIQEARSRIKFIMDTAISKAGGDVFKEHIKKLEMQADPPDAEADGHMNKESMKSFGLKLKELLLRNG